MGGAEPAAGPWRGGSTGPSCPWHAPRWLAALRRAPSMEVAKASSPGLCCALGGPVCSCWGLVVAVWLPDITSQPEAPAPSPPAPLVT